MVKNTVIQYSKGILGGTPVFKGTRVPIRRSLIIWKPGIASTTFSRISRR